MQNGLPHKDANFLVNRTEQKVLRRELRTCGTSAEAAMWRMLKSRQVENVKFRRQFGVGAYVIDFYSPELRLGIELDGQQHFLYNGKEHDSRREDFLRKQHGITLLRIENKYVFKNPEGVLREIKRVVGELRNPSVSTADSSPINKGAEKYD